MSMLKHISVGIVLGFLCYHYYKNVYVGKKLENVLNGLILQEQSVDVSTVQNLSIAVGFGSCLDLFVEAVGFMESLQENPPSQKKHHQNINSLTELSEMFLFFFSEGAAAERYIPEELFNQLVSKASGRPEARWVGGGNAPVITSRFHKEGFQNLLVVTRASEKLKSFYSDDIQYSESTNVTGDVHLILEYKVGEKWGNYVAPRANRFIVHSDQNNPYVRSLEVFEQKLQQNYAPRLVVISALQMLDNYPFKTGEREARMEKLSKLMHNLSPSTLIHFEMASFSEEAMIKELLKNVLPYVDSVGMNEQELPNLVSMAKHSKVTVVADANPRTAIVLDDMRQLYQFSKSVSVRGLSRIHVHTLAFQAILVKKGSQWKNNRAASAKASLVAHRHVCAVEEIVAANSRLIMDDSFSLSAKTPNKRIHFNETAPISCWDEDDYEVCLAPVLVCTKVTQTAGGGDNITPAGLMLQL